MNPIRRSLTWRTRPVHRLWIRYSDHLSFGIRTWLLETRQISYRRLSTDWPLVIVGGNTYKPSYVRQLKSLADQRVIFTGPVYGDHYWTLQQNAGLFVFAGEIGGIHPALVESMAAGNAILYLDTPANRETVAECGVSFQPEEGDLGTKLTQLIGAPKQIEELRERARQVARENYGWDRIVDQYESLFSEMRR